MRVSPDGRRDIRSDRKEGNPPGPRKNHGQNLCETDGRAHPFSFRKPPVAPQTNRTKYVDDIADTAGDRAEEQQVYRIKQVRQKLYSEKAAVALALEREEKQNRSHQTDRLYEDIPGAHLQ